MIVGKFNGGCRQLYIPLWVIALLILCSCKGMIEWEERTNFVQQTTYTFDPSVASEEIHLTVKGRVPNPHQPNLAISPRDYKVTELLTLVMQAHLMETLRMEGGFLTTVTAYMPDCRAADNVKRLVLRWAYPHNQAQSPQRHNLTVAIDVNKGEIAADWSITYRPRSDIYLVGSIKPTDLEKVLQLVSSFIQGDSQASGIAASSNCRISATVDHTSSDAWEVVIHSSDEKVTLQVDANSGKIIRVR